jgi:eukaryotic-like serine/threonine-protein kinase
MVDLLQEYDSRLPRRISFVSTVILLLAFIPAQQHLSLLLQPEEAMAQQTLGQVTNQKIPVAGSNFTNYTNPKYGFSLLYPIAWVNEEIDPGLNLTFLMTFDPPASEFGEFVFFYIAVKNLTDDTSLKQFTDQEISMLKRPPAAAFPTEDTGAKLILESQPTTIAGNMQAHKVVYIEKVSGTLSKIMEIYAVNRDKGYILSYFVAADAYEKYLPTFEKMVDSLNLTSSSI